jgi:small subunit ribosomal protein S2
MHFVCRRCLIFICGVTESDNLGIKTPFLPPNSTPAPKPNPLETSLSALLATGAALGHASGSLNASFAPYIYGNRHGLSIIDLDQTLPILRRTAAMVRDVVKADGVVLMVGSKPGMRKYLEKAKVRLGDNGYMTTEWRAGLLTNAPAM